MGQTTTLGVGRFFTKPKTKAYDQLKWVKRDSIINNRFTTYERIEYPQLVVIKHNGTRELFNRDKLLSGLHRACEKTTITSVQIEKIVSNVEQKLYSCGEPDVSSSKIGELVMDNLANVNEVAYVRFASVYRRFKDIASFEQELSQIRQHQTEQEKSA